MIEDGTLVQGSVENILPQTSIEEAPLWSGAGSS